MNNPTTFKSRQEGGVGSIIQKETAADEFVEELRMMADAYAQNYPSHKHTPHVLRTAAATIERLKQCAPASLDEALGLGKEGHCISCGNLLEGAEPIRTPCNHVSPITGKSTVMANGQCHICDSYTSDRESKIKGNET